MKFSVRRALLYPAICLLLLAILIHRPLPPGFCKSSLDKAVFHVIEPTLRLTYYWPLGVNLDDQGCEDWRDGVAQPACPPAEHGMECEIQDLFSKYLISKVTDMVWWTRIVLNALSPILGPKWESHGHIHTETVEWAGVRTRVYSPRDNTSTTGGAVIFIHGGGFAQGNIDIYCSMTKRLADSINSVVVSIDYRLSPEAVYPSQLEDCENVINYFMSISKEKYNVDPAKIVIMGDSAGGNLAAVITHRRKLRGDSPPLAAQVLIYPLLQMADLQSLSYRYYRKNLDGFALVDPESVVLYYMMYSGIDMNKNKDLAQNVLTNGHITPERREIIQKYLRYDQLYTHYNYSEEALPQRADVIPSPEAQKLLEPWIVNPEFSPIMREDLSGLPKAFVMTCEYDVLRDEGIMYAVRLKEAGVPTTFRNYKNGFHAMLNFHYEIGEASAALDDIAEWTATVLKEA